MRSLLWISLAALVSWLAPLPASADDAPVVAWTQQRVQDGLVKPLARQENFRFSRARPAPHERRVRVLSATSLTDAKGRAFVPFAIDVRYGQSWSANDIVGCAYRDRGDLYVKMGDAYRPASVLLGSDADPAPGVCEAPPQS